MSKSLCRQSGVQNKPEVQNKAEAHNSLKEEIQSELKVQSELKRCPFCLEIILSDAKKCKHCLEFLDPKMRAKIIPQPEMRAEVVEPQLKWSPALAAVLSLLMPGGGHLYRGKIITGFLWTLFVVIGYSLYILPGIILHLVCISFAAIGNPLKD